jgi:hypothetical protein
MSHFCMKFPWRFSRFLVDYFQNSTERTTVGHICFLIIYSFAHFRLRMWSRLLAPCITDWGAELGPSKNIMVRTCSNLQRPLQLTNLRVSHLTLFLLVALGSEHKTKTLLIRIIFLSSFRVDFCKEIREEACHPPTPWLRQRWIELPYIAILLRKATISRAKNGYFC